MQLLEFRREGVIKHPRPTERLISSVLDTYFKTDAETNTLSTRSSPRRSFAGCFGTGASHEHDVVVLLANRRVGVGRWC